MRAMRRFAVSVVVRHGLTRSAARRLTALVLLARVLPARGTAMLRAAALGLIALIVATTAALASLAASAVLAFGTGPALATVASAPQNTLASVIPSTATPQSRVTFAVYCTNPRATSATLVGRALGLTKHIKMRPNPAAGDFTVAVILPGSIQPGTYHPSIECSDGTSTTARLLVPAIDAAGGTSDGVGTWLTVGGLLFIGLGAVTGSIVLRRRHAGLPDQADRADQADQADRADGTGPSEHSDRFDYSGHSNFRFLARRATAARARNDGTSVTAEPMSA